MLDLVMLATAEGGEESSKALFYILGGILAGVAVLVSAVGMSRPDWPSSDNAARGITGLFVLLVLGTSAAVIITA